ncbi:MAG: PKD domain-containing protein, partial [Actinobacteria bacterium]|nr:PKD domain-containing protein [Actinomycetota bacterium]
NNNWDLTIGGKPECDQVTVTCDYFTGDIDWVRIEKGQATGNTPPTANFTPTCTYLACTFNGSASSDPGGSITSYAWNWGDSTPGSSGTSSSGSHTYAAAGTYTVTLTVTDNQGATGSTTRTVTVAPNTPPVARFTSNCVNATCTFNGSTSSDANGPMASYTWDFQTDGTPDATGATPPAVTFPGAGDYNVTLTVTDSAGAPNSVSHVVTIAPDTPPTAAFTATCSDLACSFNGSTSSDANGPIAHYTWDFGDGTTGIPDAANVTHTYTGAGPFTVGLVVTDGGGNTGTAPTQTLDLTNQPPVAAFTQSCTNLDCTFTSTSTDPNGAIQSYSWDFGDGTPAGSGASVSHHFSAGNAYTVTLTVTDAYPGAPLTDTEQATVTVTDPPAATVAYVGSATGMANASTHVVTVPASVQPGDALLLFFSDASNVTVNAPTNVTGWTQVDRISNTNGSTTLWRKIAVAGDAGKQIRVTVSALSKGALTVMAYRGTAANPVAAFGRSLITSGAGRTTPTAAVATPTYVVSYWAHRDSASTSLTPPGGVAVRTTGTQTGGGRLNVLAADSGASVGPGNYGGLTATANGGSSSWGTAWTVVLAPA